MLNAILSAVCNPDVERCFQLLYVCFQRLVLGLELLDTLGLQELVSSQSSFVCIEGRPGCDDGALCRGGSLEL